jgi:diguanylate cyclase (GGDEF)-like protein
MFISRLILVISCLHSIPIYAMSESLPFTRLSDVQGLPNNEITASLLDSHGYMWFGTTAGLSRYDGSQLVNFRHNPENVNSLSDDHIWSLYEDDKGILWIGTQSGGLNRFDPNSNRFTAYMHDPEKPQSLSHNYVRKIISASNNKLWIGTSGGGLELFDPATGLFKHFVHLAENNNSLAGNYIRALLSDQNGGLWIGTRHNGLSYLSPDQLSFTHYRATDKSSNGLSSNMIQCLLFASKNQLLVGTWDGGLNQLDIAEQRWTNFPAQPSMPSGLKDMSVISMLKSKKGDIWLGTVNGGLHLFNPQTQDFLSSQNQAFNTRSLPKGGIYTLAEDNQGFIWSGTWGGGAASVNPKAKVVTRYQHQPDNLSSLPAGSVEGVVVDKQGTLWVGVEGGGLSAQYRGKKGFIKYPLHLPGETNVANSDIEVLYLDPYESDIIWIGTRFRGLIKFNIQSKESVWIEFGQPSYQLFKGEFVQSIYRDSQKALWVGTSTGLSQVNLKDKTVRNFNHQADKAGGISEGSVNAIFEDSNHNIWVATSIGGLNRLNVSDSTFSVFKNKPQVVQSISSNTIWDIVEDKNNTLWIATSRGLNRLENINASEENALFDRFGTPKFASILLDKSNNVWLSSQKGIFKFSPLAKDFKLYDISDGVLGHHSYPAKYIDDKGVLYIGGEEGLTIFSPSQLESDKHDSKVLFSALMLNNKLVDTSNPILNKRIEDTNSIRLPYTEAVFSLVYSTLNYSHNNKVKYRYMLHGFNDSWTETLLNQVTYTSLEAGQYLLEINASNKEGEWNKESSYLKIEIESPPWKSIWAYTIYTILFLAAGYLYNIQQKRRIAYLTLLEVSETDQLTGLKNRYFIEKNIDSDVKLSLRYYRHLLLQKSENKDTQVDMVFFIIDLDHFKHVNDEYGHQAGDQVLKQIKKILKVVFRDTDYLVRWGGEEFLVVARFTKRKFAPELAERLRSEVANHPFKINSEQTIEKTCSIGFCPYPLLKHAPDTISWSKTLELADHCLYAAKNSKRNAWVGICSLSNEINGDKAFISIKNETKKLIQENGLEINSSISDISTIKWNS